MRRRPPPAGAGTAPARVEQALTRALACQAAGDLTNAERAWRAVLRHCPGHAAALQALAALLATRGEHRQAAKQLETLLAGRPDDDGLALALAQTWLAAGALDAAARICGQLASRPAHRFEALCVTAEIAERRGDWERAIEAYRAAAAERPMLGAVLVNEGLAHRARGRPRDALAAFERALALEPRSASAWNNRGNVERDLELPERAIESYTEALEAAPELLEARFNRGLAHLALGEVAAAARDFTAVLERAPDHEQAALQLAETRIAAGEFEAARHLLDALLARQPDSTEGWYLRATLERAPVDGELVARLEQRLRAAGPRDLAARTQLEFALGRLAELEGEHARAFAHFERANRLRHTGTEAAAGRDTALLEALAAVPAAAWNHPPLPAPPDAPRVVFVIGMPRSGTTLVEQLLAGHSQVAAAGEVNWFGPALTRLLAPDEPATLCAEAIAAVPDDALAELRTGYLARLRRLAGPSPVVTDKTPHNFAFLGLLRRLFPDACFVHCVRHPLDTCLSIYQQLFGTLHYANDLDAIAAYFTAYRALMRRWRGLWPGLVQDVRYEALVTEPEATVRALLEGCRLPFEPGCLDNRSSGRAILTASRWQARQPVYRSALGRWRNHERALAPLRAAWPELALDE